MKSIKFCGRVIFLFVIMLIVMNSFIPLQSIAQPSWINTYPTIANGATSADIALRLDQASVVYYAVFTVKPTDTSALAIKQEALKIPGGNLVRAGKREINSVNKDFVINLSGLEDNKIYYFYLVAESAFTGLQPNNNVKTFERYFPKRLQENSYLSKFKVDGKSQLMGYLSYFPEAYYKNPTANFPVLISLHGGGEMFWQYSNLDSLKNLTRSGVPRNLSKGQEFPFIVIAPQCPFSDWDKVPGNNNDLILNPGGLVKEVIDTIKNKFRIENKKIYVTGLSKGGTGTWSVASNYADEIAAIIPIDGFLDNVKNTPCYFAEHKVSVWAFQGEGYGEAVINEFTNNYNICQTNNSALARTSIYPKLGHDTAVWNSAYDNRYPGLNENIYDWLLKQSKPDNNVAPTANAGINQKIRSSLTTLTLQGNGYDQDGTFVNFFWKQISGNKADIGNSNNSQPEIKNLSEGIYDFRLIATDVKGASDTDFVSIEVLPQIINPVLSELLFYNASTNSNIVSFKNGYILDLSDFNENTKFTFLANTNPKNIDSVAFFYDGLFYHMEYNDSLYSFTGEAGVNGQFNLNFKPEIGLHQITAVPYLNGVSEEGVSINFTVKKSVITNIESIEIDNLTFFFHNNILTINNIKTNDDFIISDLNGRLIEGNISISSRNSFSSQIDFTKNSVNPGLYFINAISDEKIYTFKFIVE